MEEYFKSIEKKVNECYEIAILARKKGFDPKKEVEISFAKDLADRVEELVGPKGISHKIRKYLKEKGREETAIQVAIEICENMQGSHAEIIEQSVRTGLAILTEGVLVAPIEGISSVEIGKNSDGSKYVDLYFSGPIRSAGGTGEAMSVLIADVVRRKLGLDRYKPTDDEVERYKEEIPLYDRMTHLQYLPSPEEIELIIRNCPICINGEPTEKEEVMGKRDLPRIKTNRIRGGACLVIAEGLCLKAPKLMKHVARLKLEGWDFLKNFSKELDENKEIAPSERYIEDLIGGRPVISHPSRKGGFRLRYGRGRTCGLGATAIHPATMYLLDGFIAVGTQLKTERPGKGTIATPCDTIEGAMVLLDNGDFIQINSIEEAIKIAKNVKKIIDLGEILIPFGEFFENNSILPPASFCYEWWIKELEEKANIEEVKIKHGIDNFESIYFEKAIELSKEYDIPLHPSYNLFWHDISKEEFQILREFIRKGIYDGKLYLEKDKRLKEILLSLGVTHLEREKYIVEKYADVLIKCCGFEVKNGKIFEVKNSSKEAIEAVQEILGIRIIPKALHRIGARMGRPEKSSERKMDPPPHVLFPAGIGKGGKERVLNTAGKINAELGERKCEKCGRITYKTKCECGGHTYFTGNTKNFEIDVGEEISKAEKKLNIQVKKVKGVIGLSSSKKTPECIEKGIIRAKYDVYVFKDGTARYDMTNMPLTHFKPYEIGLSLDKLKELGYEHDYKGEKLVRENQIIELKPQDVIPSKKCGEYFLRISKYIDEILSKIYGMKPFYNANSLNDLIGHLVVGLSPHTSAGIVGRIIGFIDLNVCCAHPFFHAAKRRNCDGDEDSLMLLTDVLINFSKEYIPEKRGGKMDLPLVIAMRISPSEIDKEALSLDTLNSYPLIFYRKTHEYAHPKELEKEMDLVANRLGSEREYKFFGFTHDTSNIGNAPKTSSYKLYENMEEKVIAQINLAKKIRAVDEVDVVTKIIQKHFLTDLTGNLKAFTKQQFRCTNCNTKYRRIPLNGKCGKCGNSLSLTVHESSIKKYLGIIKKLSDEFKIPNYVQQRIILSEKFVESLFKDERDKTLTDFF
ncbi:MAG: DNA polymerase II large subunit [Thermoplasmatales archaeon]|nr:DNA polymerase II large subunit [Thermoplasmatales archaeon]